MTQRDGRRWSAADAYLHPVSSQPNLTVLTDARATQVVVEANPRRRRCATCGTGRRRWRAPRPEVIVAAGAIGSPHLLMLSGIGPADHLHEHGIIVHADNPGVGANLSGPPGGHRDVGHPAHARACGRNPLPVNLARWRLRHSGPLTSNVAEAGGFTRTRPSLPAPDLQWHALPTPYQREGLADPRMRAFSLLITLVDVGSRGRIRLRSADPGTSPPSTRPTCPTAPTSSRWWRGSGWPASSPAPTRSPRSASPSCRRGRRSARMRRCGEFIRGDLGTLFHPVGTPARWAATPGWRPAS